MKVKIIFSFLSFFIIDNKVPGPQKYDAKTLINGTGYIFNSKFSSSPAKTISGRNKLVTSKLKSKIILLIVFYFLAPGPGAYRSFPEFGIYKSKYADENEKSQNAQKTEPK